MKKCLECAEERYKSYTRCMVHARTRAKEQYRKNPDIQKRASLKWQAGTGKEKHKIICERYYSRKKEQIAKAKRNPEYVFNEILKRQKVSI